MTSTADSLLHSKFWNRKQYAWFADESSSRLKCACQRKGDVHASRLVKGRGLRFNETSLVIIRSQFNQYKTPTEIKSRRK